MTTDLLTKLWLKGCLDGGVAAAGGIALVFELNTLAQGLLLIAYSLSTSRADKLRKRLRTVGQTLQDTGAKP